MTRISSVIPRSLLPALAVAFLVGVIMGLVVLGWWLWPVQWTSASPADLQEAWQRTYLSMVADSYTLTGDALLARERIEALATPSRTVAQITLELQAMAQARTTANDTDGASRLQALAAALSAPPGTIPAPGTVPVAPRAEAPLFTRLLRVCGLVILVLVILAGLLLLVYFLQSRTTAPTEPAVEARISATAAPTQVQRVPAAAQATATPLSQFPAPGVARTEATAGVAALGPFVATYNLGDIDFDMSFGIESPTGDFLGECGLGMAETIGGGEVQKVTAFEVWLFDKADIRTVSLVLASAHAHSDAALRSKLASRGEVVLAQQGSEFSVKTSSLELQGRVLDLTYGGGDVPAQSYFTSFSVQLVPVLLASGHDE